jgi:AcrR family transcriptional regulator
MKMAVRVPEEDAVSEQTEGKISQLPVSGLSQRALATREKIKRSAKELINLNGYSKVRVEDITADAGVAKGLFYRYFQDLKGITLELCMELFEDVLAESLEKDIDEDIAAFDWLYEFSLTAVSRFINNRGLLACMFELNGSFPGISEGWTETARQWNLHLAEFVCRATGMSKRDSENMGYILGAAMEGIIYQAAIRSNRDIINVGPDAKSIAQTISMLWYRIIFLEPPPRSGRRNKFLLGRPKTPSE